MKEEVGTVLLFILVSFVPYHYYSTTPVKNYELRKIPIKGQL